MSGDAYAVMLGMLGLGGGIGFGAYCLVRLYHTWLDEREAARASRNG